MLKYKCRVLKYIHKHPQINKADLLKKFPDFESCLPEIYEYLDIEDENHLIEQAEEHRVTTEAGKLYKSVYEQSEYISKHRKEYDYNDSIVLYSTNKLFNEACEQKKGKLKKSIFKVFISFLKFIITYVLGIASGLIIAYLTHKFNW